jgi:hypothetical protein
VALTAPGQAGVESRIKEICETRVRLAAAACMSAVPGRMDDQHEEDTPDLQ